MQTYENNKDAINKKQEIARQEYNKRLLNENLKLQKYREHLRKQRETIEKVEDQKNNAIFQQIWKANPI